MDWTNSHAFWWLAGLAIPVVIHLLSKKRQQLIRIGSTRFINPSETMSSKSIHFTQWILFLIRSLIIICLVMIVAKPLLKRNENQKQVYVEDVVAALYEEGVMEPQKRMDDDDKITFSINGNNHPPSEFSSYWTFIHFLNHQKNEATVFADNSLSKFSGSAELLTPKVEWVVVPHKENITLTDTVYGNTGLIPITYTISEEILNYDMGDPIQSYKKDTTFIKVVSSQESSSLKEHFDLIIQAIDSQLPWKIISTEASHPDWIIAIDTSVISHGVNHIEFQPGKEHLKFRKVNNQLYKLSGNLDLKALTLSDFLDQWTPLIISDHIKLKEFDKRRINGLPVYAAEENTVKASNVPGQNADLPLWIAFFLLVAIERILSIKNQA